MDKIPNKWKKHLVLADFGFKTHADLKQEIHRYPSHQIANLLKDIASEMGQDSGNLYTISFIPTLDCYKLPNATCQTLAELETLKQNLDSNLLRRSSEVWYCKKPYRDNPTSSIGRFSIQNQKGFVPSIKRVHEIEQVWNCSHREIEHFTSRSEVRYIRASREGWHRAYTIDSIRSSSKEEQKQMVEQFFQSVAYLEEHQDKIQDFLRYLSSLEINQLALEYMYSEKGFSIIDWDTENDLAVIHDLFPSEKDQILYSER